MIKTAIYADDYIKLLGEISSQEEPDEWLHHAHRYCDDHKKSFVTFAKARDFIKENAMKADYYVRNEQEDVIGEILFDSKSLLYKALRYRDGEKANFMHYSEASRFVKATAEKISDDEKVLGDVTQTGESSFDAYYDHNNRRRTFKTKEAAAQWIKNEAKRDGVYVTKEPAARIIANNEKITGATIKLKDSYKAIRFTGKEEERVFASEAKALAWLQPDPIEQFIAWIAENNVALCMKTSRGYSPLTEHGLKLALTAYREETK